MVRHLFAVLTGLLVTFLAGPASAGWFICNNTGSEVDVAVAWSNQNGWNSSGWYRIQPRDCALPIAGSLQNRHYYFYVKGGGQTWSGDKKSGGYFCVDLKDKFFYTYTGNPSCDGFSFMEVDVGESNVYTTPLVELTTNPTDAALHCQPELTNGRDAFAKCWTRQIATTRQRQILDCVYNTNTSASLAVCASKGYISDDAQRIADCTLKYSDNKQPIQLASCLNNGVLDKKSEASLICAIQNQGNFTAIADCAAGV